MPGYTKPQVEEERYETYAALSAAYLERLASRDSSFNNVGTSFGEILHEDPQLGFGLEEMFPGIPAEDINPAVDLRLGWTVLTVPPHEIRITEDRHNEEVPILRGRGSALVKTGRGHIRINMPLRFASDLEVNNELRQIVAQFRTCPFTTVESDVISTAVLLKRADRAAVSTYKEARDTKELAFNRYQAAKLAAIQKLAKYPGHISSALDKTYAELSADLQEETPAAISAAISAMVAAPPLPWLAERADFMSTMREAEDAVEKAQSLYSEFLTRSQELAKAQIQAHFAFPTVPVALHQMTARTAPGYPEMIEADLELFYFNTEPFMPVTTFVGPTMNPTGDITNCAVYRDHLQQWLDPESQTALSHMSTNLGLGTVKDSSRGMLVLEYPTTDAVRVKKDAPRLSDQEYTVPAPSGAEEKEDFEFRTKPAKIVVGGDSEYIILEQVIVSLENRLAPQPVEGHMYGTLQYMGQTNAKIRLVFTVRGEDETHYLYYLQKLHEIKKQTEEVALRYGDRIRRNARISIDHDLVRLFGIQYVLLDRITTRTKGPGSAEVVLELTEYTTSQEKRERLLKTATQSKRRIRIATLKYLADVAGSLIHGAGSAGAKKLVDESDLVGDGPEWALETLYTNLGLRGGYGEPGIITEEVLTKVFSSDHTYKAQARQYAESRTSAPPERPRAPTAEISRLGRWISDHAAEGPALSPYRWNSVPTSVVRRGVRELRLDVLASETDLLKILGDIEWTSSQHSDTRVDLNQILTLEARDRPTGPRHALGRQQQAYSVAVKQYEIERKEAHSIDMRAWMRRLAREHITYWSRRQLQSLRPESDVLQAKMASIGNVEIPPIPPESILDRVVDVILQEPYEFRAEHLNLQLAVEKGPTVFSGLKTQSKQIRESSRIQSMYPDLNLPDYATAYRRLWSAIRNKTGYNLLGYNDLNKAGLPPRIKALVRLAIPSYDDLGLRPPWGREISDFARTLSDIVDPDFYFFWNRVKSTNPMQRVLKRALEEASVVESVANVIDPADEKSIAKALKEGRTKIDRRAAVRPGLPPANAGKYPTSPTPADPIIQESAASTIDEAGNETSVPLVSGGGVGTRYMYKSPHPDLQKMFDDINPDDKCHRERLFKAAIDSVPDRFQRLVTAFPTFRMTLVESDIEDLGVWDDFYGYNSIRSIHIRHHKYTPTIAEIEVVNVTGNLDESRTVASDQERAALDKRHRTGAGKREEKTGEREDLSAFFLDAGTPISIRLGYSSKEEELEIRFVGQIVALTAGDIIRITAQGYGSELTVPINEIIDGRNELNIVETIMKESPTTHFGVPKVATALTKQERAGLRNPASGEIYHFAGATAAGAKGRADEVRDDKGWLEDLFGWVGGPERWLADFQATRKTSNVFLPLEQNWRKIRSAGSGGEWGIPNTTGLQALHELCRSKSGFVFGVRPYETHSGSHQATLFFGRPEQPYVYTDLKRDEEMEWLDAKWAAEKEDETSERVEKILKQFYASPYGGYFSETVTGLKGASKNMGAVAGRSGRKLVRSRAKSLFSASPAFYLADLLGWFDAGEGAADLLYDEEVWRQKASPARLTELNTIEEKIGHEGLHNLAFLFFDKYSNDETIEGFTTPAWIQKAYQLGAKARAYKEDFSALTRISLAKRLLREVGAVGGPRPPVGLTLYHYVDWRHALTSISKDSSGHEDAVNQIFWEAFGDPEDESAVPMVEGGFTMPREYFKHMSRSVVDWLPVWKSFLFWFSIFLQTAVDEDLLSAVCNASLKSDGLSLSPRMKRFRGHHFVHSAIDIVKNDICVSQEFMANRVIVNYPDTESFEKFGDNLVIYKRPSKGATLEVGYDDDIQSSDHRVRVISEPNALNQTQAYFCAKSNLAEALRPMYRGQILLRGNEKANPFDTVWIHDAYNDVYGPIEVESVTDHFDQTGYYISVVPNAMAIVESGAEYADTGAAGTWWIGLGLVVGVLLAVPTYGASIPAGAYVGSYMADAKTRAKTGKGLYTHIEDRIITWIVGQGLYGKLSSRVKLVPLIRRGMPWTSGLRGIGVGGWKARIGQRYEDIKTGFNLVVGSEVHRRIPALANWAQSWADTLGL